MHENWSHIHIYIYIKKMLYIIIKWDLILCEVYHYTYFHVFLFSFCPSLFIIMGIKTKVWVLVGKWVGGIARATYVICTSYQFLGKKIIFFFFHSTYLQILFILFITKNIKFNILFKKIFFMICLALNFRIDYSPKALLFYGKLES